MQRFENAMDKFKQDKFRRLFTAAIVGIMLSYLVPMDDEKVFIGLFPASLVLGMDRFSLGKLAISCITLLLGIIAGTLADEAFYNIPVVAVMLTYIIYFTTLKAFASRVAGGYIYNFAFSYTLATVFASYSDKDMELCITQFFALQLAGVFLLVWGCFVLFPTQKPQVKAEPLPEAFRISDSEVAIYALVWLGFWMIFMLVEWSFAIFAFFTFIAAFRNFERSLMKWIAKENMIIHIVSCLTAALFSMLILGMSTNILVLLTGLIPLLFFFCHRAVYPPTPELGYRCNTMIAGVIVPLILYITPVRAGLNKSLLRATLIICLMTILWLVIEYLYHGKKSLKRLSYSLGDFYDLRLDNLRGKLTGIVNVPNIVRKTKNGT